MTQGLPEWRSVLAVVAHPDDESFGLGALLSTFVAQGAEVSVLCLTHGEASTLHGVDGDLAEIRARELADAARELGIVRVELRDYADGRLSDVALDVLRADIAAVLLDAGAEGVVVFDPDGVTGHADHRRATEVAVTVADDWGIPVLGWTIPASVAEALNGEHGTGFRGHGDDDVDLVVTVDREAQSRAVACHPSQAVPGSVLWRRLELLGDHEHLRWLTPASGARP